MKEIFLFIIWQKARHKEDDILSRIASRFTILKEYAVTWRPENFHRNMVAFSYGCLVSTGFHMEHKGDGEFLVIIAEDKNPVYEERSTAQGNVIVNRNSYDIKYTIRAELLDNRASFHSTNNSRETRHDFALLFGIGLDDWIKNTEFDNVREVIKRDTTPVEGYKTLEDVFYLLNEVCDYVVLGRNFSKLPSEKQISETDDIDILVDDLQNFITSIRADTEWRRNLFETRNYIDIDGKKWLFHISFIGDEYHDENFQRDILRTRVKDVNNIYRPWDDLFFWTLLYKGLYLKPEIIDAYTPLLLSFAQKAGIDFKVEHNSMCSLLDNWLKHKGYRITKPVVNYNKTWHTGDVFPGRRNILTPSLIDNENKFILCRSRHGTSVFSRRLIGVNPELASKLVMFGEGFGLHPFLNYSTSLLSIDSPELKPYRKWLKPNILFLSFRKKYGKVSLVSAVFDGKNIRIKTKYLNTLLPYIKTKYLILHTREKSRYYEGIKGISLLQKTPNPMGTIEYYVRAVFEKFSYKRAPSILKGISFDMTMENCIYNGKWNFFDFEFELRGGMDRNFMLYRIAKYCYFGEARSIYEHLCKIYDFPILWDYWWIFELKVFSGITSTPMKTRSSLCRKILVLWIRIIFRSLSYIKKSTNLEELKNTLITNITYSRDYKLFKRIFGESNI